MGKRLVPAILLAAVLFLSIAESFIIHPDDLNDEQHLWDLYERWVRSFNVSRAKVEMLKRFPVFVENVRFIEASNKNGVSFKLQLNAFGDLANEEFLSIYARYRPDPSATKNATEVFKYGSYYTPSSIDWRALGAVTPVKNQQQCGSCWAFSAVAAIEGLNKILSGSLVSLSEQELVDCDSFEYGCEGGDPRKAIYFASTKGGLTTESNYPYSGNQSTCQTTKCRWESLPQGYVDSGWCLRIMSPPSRKLLRVNQYQLQLTQLCLRFYSQGVFTGPCGNNLNHAVTVVGYGTTVEGSNYWLVKNSWGTEWGEEGYIKMARDVGGPQGLCGIAMMPAYPRLIPAILFVAVLFLSIAESFIIHPDDLNDEKHLWDLYKRWARSFNVSRGKAAMRRRFPIFVENVRFIEASNNNSVSFKLQLNAFGDLTNEEFLSIYAGYRPDPSATKNATEVFKHGSNQYTPSSIDWRALGAVTPVKNQQQCGSCWAFSVVAAIEGLNKIQSGSLVSLSEQELVDCDVYEYGCEGGDPRIAIYFASMKGGLTTESNYPYSGNQSTCQTTKLGELAARVRALGLVPTNNESTLMEAVARQPISVALEATMFQFYSQGVFTGPCGNNLNHAVTVVGYGTTVDGSNYWLVKNSWGTDWGEGGYIRMARNVGVPEGLCGIAMQPAYPI
ncbi:Vignain [Nymphaea thermarum]|nr:Vignain [Nymphaea thermarum]